MRKRGERGKGKGGLRGKRSVEERGRKREA
jgi:hypothetical protein